jgi:NAD(P)-dependent dehydrogenase (short-subunit alcohol dehydrogenase family)
MTDKPLSNRVALVTGASRGIGAALAQALAAAGAHVLLVGRTQGGLEAVEQAIFEAGQGSATVVPMDITTGDHVDNLAKVVAERWGRLDLLVLNAGVLGNLSPVSHVSPKEWDKVIGVNLTANWRLVRSFDALLRRGQAPLVVGLTSGVATAPRAYWGPYAASKAALETLLHCYAQEVQNITDVRVLIVNPSRTRTRMRMEAFPGEDPATLPTPEARAQAIMALVIDRPATATRVTLNPEIETA